MARKAPKLAHKFAAAKDVLLDHDYMFKDLNALSNVKFKDMNISDDVANQIKSYTEKFLDDAKTKGCI